jgi:hypothetical protein
MLLLLRPPLFSYITPGRGVTVSTTGSNSSRGCPPYYSLKLYIYQAIDYKEEGWVKRETWNKFS